MFPLLINISNYVCRFLLITAPRSPNLALHIPKQEAISFQKEMSPALRSWWPDCKGQDYVLLNSFPQGEKALRMTNAFCGQKKITESNTPRTGPPLFPFQRNAICCSKEPQLRADFPSFGHEWIQPIVPWIDRCHKNVSGWIKLRALVIHSISCSR